MVVSVNTQVRKMHTVSIAPDQKLIDEVHGHVLGIHDFGIRQVAGERQRQLAGRAAPGDAAAIRMSAKRDPLGVYADGVVSEFTNGLTARAANVALDRTRRTPDGTTKGEVIRSIESDLDAQSDKWIDGVASKGANEAFADGRDAGYEQYKDEIGSVIYSALLDINTCGNCADSDGADGATPDDIPDVPNPDCDGGDKCRCVHVYVFADEGTHVAATAGRLLAYSDDQPRDEHGRWSGGGAADGFHRMGTSDEAMAADTKWADLEREKAAALASSYDNREGGDGYTPGWDSTRDYELKLAYKELIEARAAEWTSDRTQLNRAEWNRAIESGEARDAAGRIDKGKLEALVRRVGFAPAELKFNLSRHGIR